MLALTNTTTERQRRWLGRIAFGIGLAIVGLLTTGTILMIYSLPSGLAPAYDELIWAANQPALYRLFASLDVTIWLLLGSMFILFARLFRPTARIASVLIALCGAGQAIGPIGDYVRLLWVSQEGAHYLIAEPAQRADILRAYLECQAVIDAHFAIGGLLWGIGLVLVARVAWASATLPRWPVALIGITSAVNFAEPVLRLVTGAPAPVELVLLQLVLLATVGFALARAFGRARALVIIQPHRV